MGQSRRSPISPKRSAARTRTLIVAAAFSVAASYAHGQSATPGGMPPPPGMSLAESAAMRFPQPVRVGDLLHRDVLQPVESQNVLGTVREVVRTGSGTIEVVINFGGFFGFGARPIAVPLDAMVLLGQDMEVVAFTPQQLRSLPTFSAPGTSPLPDDLIIRVGLAKPSH
jgi:PRC-barrel domain